MKVDTMNSAFISAAEFQHSVREGIERAVMALEDELVISHSYAEEVLEDLFTLCDEFGIEGIEREIAIRFGVDLTEETAYLVIHAWSFERALMKAWGHFNDSLNETIEKGV